MKQHKHVSVGAMVIGAVVGMQAAALAGPLLPPVGPVTSTGKTLTQIEPRTEINSVNTPGSATATFRITRAGSYYLSGNVRSDAKFAIEITVGNVTLDLNGFVVEGTNSAPGGIVTGANSDFLDGITVKNGSVVGFAGPGIDLQRSSALNNAGTKVIDVHVSSVSGTGIAINSGVIERCSVNFASGDGISASGQVSVLGCEIRNCSQGSGISMGGGGVVRDCVVSTCLEGFRAFSTVNSTYSTSFIGCRAVDNSDYGFVVSRSTLHGCVAEDTSFIGFSLSDSSATGCTAARNSFGGFNTGASTLLNCVAEENNVSGFSLFTSHAISCTASNTIAIAGETNAGFKVGNDASVSECTSVNNEGYGFLASSVSSPLKGARFENCIARDNRDAQFASFVPNATFLRCEARGTGNTGSAGFLLSSNSSSNILDECIVYLGLPNQFQIDGNNNVVMRCRAMGTTPAFVVSGTTNSVAPVATFSTIGTNTNPHVNFRR